VGLRKSDPVALTSLIGRFAMRKTWRNIFLLINTIFFSLKTPTTPVKKALAFPTLELVTILGFSTSFYSPQLRLRLCDFQRENHLLTVDTYRKHAFAQIWVRVSSDLRGLLLPRLVITSYLGANIVLPPNSWRFLNLLFYSTLHLISCILELLRLSYFEVFQTALSGCWLLAFLKFSQVIAF